MNEPQASDRTVAVAVAVAVAAARRNEPQASDQESTVPRSAGQPPQVAAR